MRRISALIGQYTGCNFNCFYISRIGCRHAQNTTSIFSVLSGYTLGINKRIRGKVYTANSRAGGTCNTAYGFAHILYACSINNRVQYFIEYSRFDGIYNICIIHNLAFIQIKQELNQGNGAL